MKYDVASVYAYINTLVFGHPFGVDVNRIHKVKPRKTKKINLNIILDKWSNDKKEHKVETLDSEYIKDVHEVLSFAKMVRSSLILVAEVGFERLEKASGVVKMSIRDFMERYRRVPGYIVYHMGFNSKGLCLMDGKECSDDYTPKTMYIVIKRGKAYWLYALAINLDSVVNYVYEKKNHL